LETRRNRTKVARKGQEIMAVQEAAEVKKFSSPRKMFLKVKISHSRARTYCSKKFNNWAAGWISGAIFWLVTYEVQRFF